MSDIFMQPHRITLISHKFHALIADTHQQATVAGHNIKPNMNPAHNLAFTQPHIHPDTYRNSIDDAIVIHLVS